MNFAKFSTWYFPKNWLSWMIGSYFHFVNVKSWQPLIYLKITRSGTRNSSRSWPETARELVSGTFARDYRGSARWGCGTHDDRKKRTRNVQRTLAQRYDLMGFDILCPILWQYTTLLTTQSHTKKHPVTQYSAISGLLFAELVTLIATKLWNHGKYSRELARKHQIMR